MTSRLWSATLKRRCRGDDSALPRPRTRGGRCHEGGDFGSFARAEEVFVRALSLLGRWARLRGRRDSTVEWVPTVDISETDGEYLLKSRLLAVRNEGVRVAYHNGMLTITNERKHE